VCAMERRRVRSVPVKSVKRRAAHRKAKGFEQYWRGPRHRRSEVGPSEGVRGKAGCLEARQAEGERPCAMRRAPVAAAVFRRYAEAVPRFHLRFQLTQRLNVGFRVFTTEINWIAKGEMKRPPVGAASVTFVGMLSAGHPLVK
jgi:hypothetical protein